MLLPKSSEMEQIFEDIAHYRGGKHKTSLMENEIRLKNFIDCPSVSPDVKTYKQKIKIKSFFYNAFLYIFSAGKPLNKTLLFFPN